MPEDVDTITEESMHTIAQGVDGAYPLPPTAARELAMDTEYFTRELIALALTFRSHCKATALAPEHVASALRMLTGRQPLGSMEGGRPFRAVPQCGGVYVVEDSIVALAPLRSMLLPPAARTRAPAATWLRAPTQPAAVSAPAALAGIVRSALSDGGTLERAEQALSRVPAAGAHAALLACILARETHSSLRMDVEDDAVNARLARVLTLSRALLKNASPGARSAGSLAIIARIVLSILLSSYTRPVGNDGVNDDGARTLAHVLAAATPHPPLRARIITTLVVALTDSNATLNVVLGAVQGIVLTGRTLRYLILSPYVPALAAALSRVLQAAWKLGIDHPESVKARLLVALIAEVVANALKEPQDPKVQIE